MTITWDTYVDDTSKSKSKALYHHRKKHGFKEGDFIVLKRRKSRLYVMKKNRLKRIPSMTVEQFKRLIIG
jgi:hypothetical protein